jgi:large subunit ribosomal protein L15
VQVHQVSHQQSLKRARRIGRGGKRGVYSGRGIKGQRARAGAKIRPAQRDIVKKIPKLRGYRFKSFRQKPQVVNFSKIEKKFVSGDTISPSVLLLSGMVRRYKGKAPKVKILGNLKTEKKFTFDNVEFSKSARTSSLHTASTGHGAHSKEIDAVTPRSK